MRAGLRLLRGVYVILRTDFPETFLDRVIDILAWLLTHAPWLTVFGVLVVLLVLTQPPQFWAALRRPKGGKS